MNTFYSGLYWGRAIVVATLALAISAIGMAAPRVSTVAISALPVSLPPGSSTSLTVTVTRAPANNAFSADLSISGLTSGVTASFSPSTVSFSSGGGAGNQTRTSTLTLTAASNATRTTMTATVRAQHKSDSGDFATKAFTLPIFFTQSITFPALADIVYGSGTVALGATASSGLAVSYAVTAGSATIAGSNLTATGVGTITVKASQAGNSDYLAAADVSRSFVVSKRSQLITFSPVYDRYYTDGPVNLYASSSVNLPITFTVMSGSAVIVGSTLTPTGVGSVRVRASQAGDSVTNAASDVDIVFNVAKGLQTITFSRPADRRYGSGDVSLSATSSQGLPITFTVVSGPAVVSGSTLTISGTGRVTVRASQAGNDFIEAATNVDQSFNVERAYQSISFAAIPHLVKSDAVVELAATATSGLEVSFRVISGPGVLGQSSMSFSGFGYVTVVAEQSGSDLYMPANPVFQRVYVQPIDLPAGADFYTTQQSTPLIVGGRGVLENDNGAENAFAVLTQPTEHGVVELNLDGSFNYTPHAGYVGGDTFVYQGVQEYDRTQATVVTIEVLP